MKELVEFYPRHIEKEDRHFVVPYVEHVSGQEEGSMLKEGWKFDRKLIHEKYQNIVSNAEKPPCRPL